MTALYVAAEPKRVWCTGLLVQVKSFSKKDLEIDEVPVGT